MKKIFSLFVLLLGLGLMSSGEAFFSNPALESVFHRVLIRVEADHALITLEQKIKNTAEESISFRLFQPLPEAVETEINFFVDAEGKGFERFSGEDRLNILFDQAKEHRDVRFFRLADGFERLFRSDEISLSPDQTIETKLNYSIPVQTLDDMSYVEIFADEGITHTKSEVIFQGPGTSVFTQTYGSGRSEVNDSVRTFWGEQNKFFPKENFAFFWSENPNATLEFHTPRETFVGHFSGPSTQKKFQNLQILIDRSGSMYGEKWGRIRDITDYFFEKFPETNLRIGFFDEEIDWLSDTFQPHSIDLQKQLSDALNKFKPVGKVDPEKFSDAVTTSTADLLTIWITDDPTVFQSKEGLGTQVLFSFSGDVPLSTLIPVKAQGGFIQYLFPSALKLIEKAEIDRRFAYLREGISLAPDRVMEGEFEIFPENRTVFSSAYSPLFIGRTFSQTGPSSKVTRFLMRDWASQRIAQILDRGNFTDEMLDALLAIGRTFGIETAFFQSSTDRDTLLTSLENALSRVSEQVYFLANNRGLLTSSLRYVGADPVYYSPEENKWRTWNFLDKAHTENQVRFAPFSEAQKRLFLEFSDILSEAFGTGEQVEFCTSFRCFSILDGEREESHGSDRAFLRDFDPNFWGNPYLISLVNKGLMEPEINGKMHANRAMDRGEFLKILHALKLNGESEFKQEDQKFEDVSVDSEYFPSVMWFSEKGIIKGYPDGTFRPLQGLTRAEAVKILLATDNFAPILVSEEAPVFEDALGWERPWVEESVSRGIVRGYQEGEKRLFKPHQEITRAEAAKLLVEFMK